MVNLDGTKLLDLDEAAELLGVSAKTCWSWIRHGLLVDGLRHQLPAVQLGRRLFLKPADLLAWGEMVATHAQAQYESRARRKAQERVRI